MPLVLVISMASLCFNHSLQPPRHTFNKDLAFLSYNIIPLNLDCTPYIGDTSWGGFIASERSFQVNPMMFNGIKVRRLSGPRKYSYSFTVKPI